MAEGQTRKSTARNPPSAKHKGREKENKHATKLFGRKMETPSQITISCRKTTDQNLFTLSPERIGRKKHIFERGKESHICPIEVEAVN